MGNINFLWKPYIISGTVNLIQGDSASGKSYLSQAIIAALTTGQAFPNAEPLPPCNVVIQNAENSYSNVIKPRLATLGADFSRIKSLEDENERLSLLSPKIEEIIRYYEAKLFLIDPVQGYMNLYNLETVRKTLMHLRGVAERTDCAVLLIGHLTKSQTKFQYRGLGSQDIYNAIPSILNLGKVDDDVRVLVHNKANFSDLGCPIAFTLNGGFEWIGEYDITIDELLANPLSPKRERQRDKAKAFLADLLSEGEVESNIVFSLAEDEGIPRRTLERAKTELCVRSIKRGETWFWGSE